MNPFLETLLDSPLDDTYRGIPPGEPAVPLRGVAARGWQPRSGNMALPVLTLDEAAFAHNVEQIFQYARSHGAALAPHAKTPMSPQIVQRLLDAGAWGATVANLQQAAVLLRAGVTRLMLGNEIGGAASGARLGKLLAGYPHARLLAFADSADTVRSLAAAAAEAGRPVEVLVEVGGGRAGARDDAAVAAILAAIREQGDKLALAGVATYEGAVASSDAALTASNIAALMERAARAFKEVRALAPHAPLVFTAGGSAFFDHVTQAAKGWLFEDGNAQLVLRSGAIFFHDHGTYQRALQAMDARAGFLVDGQARNAATDFRPALRLWGEVLSRPEPGLAICGFGMRDVSYDQDLPAPLAAFRGGAALPGWDTQARVTRLNDQHAFLAIAPDSELAPGDVIEFGISHPCTCLDRWRVFFGLDADGRVQSAYRTFFG
ncbi:amino acid deaminase [Achromobacter sp. K91]|uniref:alanine racemase n=1 Tax=Achromobacter sp. K91 TaxID=2292262 RepID=UPI000E67139C|nr:alanine racemase [Achromobacter sp. K91]RIJ02679.1 amino acid deaminase [Achromobacter sp. K91]